jgi:hypothetical protein
MVLNGVDFSLGKTRVHQNGPSVDSGQGQEYSHEGSRVLTNEHDTITRPHTGIYEPITRHRKNRIQLLIGPAPTGLCQCWLIWITLCPRPDYVRNLRGQGRQEFL